MVELESSTSKVAELQIGQNFLYKLSLSSLVGTKHKRSQKIIFYVLNRYDCLLADTVEPAYRLEILVGVLLGVLTTVPVTMAVLLFFLRCEILVGVLTTVLVTMAVLLFFLR